MLPVIEKLLVLQERDQNAVQLEVELGNIGPQRLVLQHKLDEARNHLEALKFKGKHLETERKELELEVQARQQLVDKYTVQQFQTKKNEEYQALAHEIATRKGEIAELEDRELDLMQQIYDLQQAAAEAALAAEETGETIAGQLGALAEREAALGQQLAETTQGREQLAAAVDGGLLPRYERLRKSKGNRVVVGVEHSVCGGCHMKLPAQIVVGCQADQEVMLCPNCGRVLYYTEGMDLAVAD
jgi:predicted  nucleic acid-binding Zn-ribbon protein